MLVERPRLVHGREVLEIGAGTGLCGIVAAKLGASKVFSPFLTTLSAGYTISSSSRGWGTSPAVTGAHSMAYSLAPQASRCDNTYSMASALVFMPHIHAPGGPHRL